MTAKPEILASNRIAGWWIERFDIFFRVGEHKYSGKNNSKNNAPLYFRMAAWNLLELLSEDINDATFRVVTAALGLELKHAP